MGSHYEEWYEQAMEKDQQTISAQKAEIARLQAERDSAWNDAIEAAYHAAEQYPQDDMTTAERDAFILGCMTARDAIRALRRDTK